MYFPFLELHTWVKISTAQPQTIYSVFPFEGAGTAVAVTERVFGISQHFK